MNKCICTHICMHIFNRQRQFPLCGCPSVPRFCLHICTYTPTYMYILALRCVFRTLQHTATHCNTLQHTAKHCNTLQDTATHCNTLQHAATHCNTLQHTAKHCNMLRHSATRNNTLHMYIESQRASASTVVNSLSLCFVVAVCCSVLTTVEADAPCDFIYIFTYTFIYIHAFL